MVARVLISVDANESDVVGERVKRKIVERAEAGLHHGPWAPFGYRHAAGGGIEPHPQHAEWVREALRRLLAGDTLYGICTSWDREGRRTPQGAVWRPRSLKTMLLRPTLVGLRVHDGVTYEGQWPAIVDAESWQRVGNLLRAPERKIRNFSSGTARKYALSGLVRCGRCEHVMTAMTASGQRSPSFICSKIATGGCGRMRISMDPLEDWVRDEVVDALDWMRWSKLIPERSTDFSDAAAVLAEEVEAMRRLTEDYYAPGNSLSPDEFRRLRHLSLKRQEAGERYLNFLAEKSRIDSIPKGEALREMWKTESSTWRREVTALAIEYLSISPFPKHMTSTVTKRKSESAEEFSQRKAEHAAKILDARVSVCFCS
jgi:site-specific DNA recombinase